VDVISGINSRNSQILEGDHFNISNIYVRERKKKGVALERIQACRLVLAYRACLRVESHALILDWLDQDTLEVFAKFVA
jgi:hypothetical protein